MSDPTLAGTALPPLKLHSIQDVSEMAGIGRHTVQRMVRAGKLARVKIGRRTLIPDDALRAFVSARRT